MGARTYLITLMLKCARNRRSQIDRIEAAAVRPPLRGE